METLSVVIPTYHRYEPLERTVNDLLNQTVPPKQIIVVDNTALDSRTCPVYFRSTETTECIYISSSKVGRVNVARNEGLAEVTSTYALYFDDDMSIGNDVIENFLRVHSEGWDAVTGTIFEQGRTLDSSEIVPNRALWSILRTQHGARNGTTIGVPSCLISVRTTMLREIGGFDEAYIYNFDDYDLGIRLWKAGITARRDTRVSVHHLKVPSGGGRVNSGAQRKLNSLTAKYYFLSKHFNRSATKLEYRTDVVLAVRQNVWHPIQLFKKVRVIRNAYSLHSTYGNSDDKRSGKIVQRAIET